uniref:Probable sodium-coupled neutral amino acid transporter 6 n=1 Tax=Phallusia mammillata TaxID=59560 RepID=A0A6F9DTA8_9ASCI|nr:probable sodium-coupled neutral amino acid transporter 6 [Phallusia mammillata]
MSDIELKPKSGSYSRGRLSKAEISVLRDRRMSQYEGKTASIPLCIFNLMNAILGSGILGLANAVANLGIALFTIMLVAVAGLAFNSIRLLLAMCDYTGESSYEALGKAAFGFSGKVLTVVNIFVHTMGAMCSFLFIVKYELPEVIRVLTGSDECAMDWYLNGDVLVIIVTIVIIMPLASAKNIGFLGYTSGFAMGCMIFFTAVIVVEHWIIPCPIREHVNDHSANSTSNTEESMGSDIVNSTMDLITSATESMLHDNPNNSSICESRTSHIYVEFEEGLENQVCKAESFTWNAKSAYAIPTMVFAFQCHASVLPIYTELDRPTKSRMHKVAVVSISNVFVLYFLASLFGYLTFYNAVGPELLLMYSAYDPTNAVILVSRIMVLICVIFSAPLLHYPARKSIVELFFENQPFSWVRHLVIMFILLTITNVLVIYVPTIREVFGFAGATCASMLVIILPSLFYIRLAPGKLLSARKLVPLLLVILGIGFMIMSMTLIIVGWIM